MPKKYRVKLSEEQRQQLRKWISSGKASARKLIHARILLKADENGQGWKDQRIAEALEVGLATVERVRQRFAEQGLAQALEAKPQPPRPEKRKLDGEAEAQLIALACSQAPTGRESWTLQLLADRLVELRVVDGVSDETVRRTLKKNGSSPG